MVGIRSVGVSMGERQSKDSFFLFWRETNTKNLCARFPTRLEEDEERQGSRAVNREEVATVIKRQRSRRGSW